MNKNLWLKDKQHFLHPWTHFESFKKEGSLILDRAKGCYLYDNKGKKYFDAVGGLWCANIGLGRQEMADAIASQVSKLTYASSFVDLSNEPAIQLAAKLAQLAPGPLNHVFFTTGGSTAIDSAFRLIRFYQNCRGKPEKKHVISRVGSYHGSTHLAMSIGGKKEDHVKEFDFITDTIHHISCPNYYRAPENLTEEDFLSFLLSELEEKILEIGPENVAAFFAEPIMGAGGVIVPPENYNRLTFEICKKYDVLYIADETVTAFGRLGEWFASKAIFQTQPDIIICAKGINSGYLPLGAAIYSDEIHETISLGDPDRVFANGYTYSGHPVSCISALKNIEIIERENLLEKAQTVGQYFEDQLKKLEHLPIVGQVRGKKLMMCLESVLDKDSKENFPSSLDIGKIIANRCDSLGLIVRPIINLNVLSPALIITESEVDFVTKTLEKGILLAVDDLKEKGMLN